MDHILWVIAAIASMFLFGAPAGEALAGETGTAPAGKVERSQTRVKGFQSPELDFQLLRQLGSASFGGATVGECLDAASRIRENDPDSWVAVFADLGRRQEADAAVRAARGHKVSARDQYWKASNSYRAAEYFADFRDQRHRELGLKSRKAFLEAMALADYRFEVLEVPFESIKLPAYFISPHRDGKRHKTIMIMSGYDGTLEEIFLAPGRCALERGYNLFLFAGPGQMDTLRFHPRSVFRPDFEKPISAALDLLLARPDVDAGRLALNGNSLGGYFAIRAAAFDPRLKALIANSPIVDWHSYLVGFIGFDPAEMPDETDFTAESIARIPEEFMNPVTKRMTAMMMARYGKPSFKSTYRAIRDFTVGTELKNIRCPVLALIGAGEGTEPRRQHDLFLKKVSGPAIQYIFSAAEGADGHCQVGNGGLACAVMFDWLDELFR